MMQQGDVLLYQSNDDGEINVSDGTVEMTGGFETSAYLSLFGGNEDDDGRADSPANWWGNLDETDPDRQYRSRTQHLLQAIPATTGNLRRIEEAAKADLAWFVSSGIASSVTVVATIPKLNSVTLTIKIVADGTETEFAFVENWKAMQ